MMSDIYRPGVIRCPDFEHLCNLAEVRGMTIGIRTDKRLQQVGEFVRRELDSIIILRGKRALGGVRIHRGHVEAAARRAMEVITSEQQRPG